MPSQMRGDVSEVVEHLFRHEAGKMVATLTRIFGVEHLTLVEDVVQEALARALRAWPFHGVPENAPAWIMRTARNLALDVVRREKVFREKEGEIIRLTKVDASDVAAPVFAEQEIVDDRLRMMFVCCHPLIADEDQVALALKTLCGFGTREIARAFLTSEAAIAKRLTRAKQRIREAGIPFEIPSGPELDERLDGVLQCLYLLYNEGYKASTGPKLVREDLCEEAMRLGGLLAEHAAGDRPATHALLALMLFSTARVPARVDAEGNLLRLQEQDRRQWDQGMIARGHFHLARSMHGEELTVYHLQAAIASCHCAAAEYGATDWGRILVLYDRLMEFDGSPIVALNRAVALAEVRGPEPGIEAVRAIAGRKDMEGYYLLHAVLGDFESRLGRREAAVAEYGKALELAEVESEKAFLRERMEGILAAGEPPSKSID